MTDSKMKFAYIFGDMELMYVTPSVPELQDELLSAVDAIAHSKDNEKTQYTQSARISQLLKQYPDLTEIIGNQQGRITTALEVFEKNRKLLVSDEEAGFENKATFDRLYAAADPKANTLVAINVPKSTKVAGLKLEVDNNLETLTMESVKVVLVEKAAGTLFAVNGETSLKRRTLNRKGMPLSHGSLQWKNRSLLADSEGGQDIIYEFATVERLKQTKDESGETVGKKSLRSRDYYVVKVEDANGKQVLRKKRPNVEITSYPKLLLKPEYEAVFKNLVRRTATVNDFNRDDAAVASKTTAALAGLNRIWLICGATSFGGKIDRFLGQIPAEVIENIMNDDAFVFCSPTRDKISVLRWQGDGFCLLYKKLANGRYIWPHARGKVVEVTADDLQRILDYPRFVARINGDCYENKLTEIAVKC
ncbi:hypothetical protein FACS1894202_11830 [Clostridia bacterium]|nr:hypothetical protein FACS1894202_11830 [Clostridia bacterium]